MLKIIELKAAIQKSFNAIGKKNGSAPPIASSNTFSEAYELLVASELRSIANKRYDAAKAAAASVGIIDENKTVEGSEITVHETEYFDISMKRAAASTTLDKTMLKNNLMTTFNMDASTADAVIAKASKPRKGAVTIGFSLKG